MLSRRLDLALATALAFGALDVSARADDRALLDLSLDELLKLEVRSASWGTASVHDAPASVTVFERHSLERLGLRNLHEVLNWVPGAYSSRVAATGLENRTVLRGNPGTAGGGLLVIDGQRVNTFHSVRAWGVLRHFPLALVERVEVIRGPGGARYGGGPSDEVVHVVTRRGETTAGASLTAQGGHGLLALLGEASGDWRFDLRASSTRDKVPEYTGLFDRFGRVDSSTETSTTDTAILDLGWRGHSVQVLHHESDIEGYYGLNGSINPGDESKVEATWWRYSGRAEPAGWQVDWFASELRQRFILGAVGLPGGRPPLVSGDLRQRGLLTHRATAGGITFRRAFGAHTLAFGGEAQRGRNTRADLQANYLLRSPFTFLGGYQSTGRRFSALGARDRMTAVYAEDDWRIGDAHRLVLGMRYDRYEQSGSAASPRLGWVWTPDERCALKLLYQEAFFAPTLSQLFLQNNPVIAGNPELKPTRVETWELIGQRQWEQVLWRATFFRRDAKDGFIVAPGRRAVITTINAVRQRSEGIETTLHWSPSPDWRLRLTGSALLDDDYVLPRQVADVPPGMFVSRRTASALLAWQPGDWELSLGGHWRSREHFQPRANDPRALLQVNWRPDDALHVWLHVDNLFNGRGADVDAGGGLGNDPRTGQVVRTLPLPDREIGLGLEYTWR